MNSDARFAELRAALSRMDESADRMCAAADALSRAVDELVAAIRTWGRDGSSRALPGDSGEWWAFSIEI